MKHLVAFTLVAALAGPSISTAGSESFSTMAVEKDVRAQCEAPRPPPTLARTAYIRNGYRAILRIMAAEKWRETDSCECFFAQITWDVVVKEAEKYVTSDNPLVPFIVADLRIKADAMLGLRKAACSN